MGKDFTDLPGERFDLYREELDGPTAAAVSVGGGE